MTQSHVTALDRAADHCGGVSKLAQALGVGQPVVSNWKARGTLVDAIYCTAIERITDGAVTRRDLRPADWEAIWPELAAAEPEPRAA
jgi:DNA-binding transcriptional regulator YdaS (Cro superfamily)